MLALFIGGALWIAGSFRGREKTAEAFAWTLTLLIFCLPVVHAWYWLTPLALGLAAGLWLPLLIAMAAPLVESLPLAAKASELHRGASAPGAALGLLHEEAGPTRPAVLWLRDAVGILRR